MNCAIQQESSPQYAMHYALHIAWGEQDSAYLVTLPEWIPRLANSVAVTHGASYEGAARNGQEALLLLIERAQERGEPLPTLQVIAYTGEEATADSA